MYRLVPAFAAATLALAAGVVPISAQAVDGTDEFRSLQWGLDRIQAEAAWSVADGTGTVIAIVDTGVDLGHPDLSAKVLPGRDFVSEDDTESEEDRNGHGTHVAGIAAAVTGNGIGVAGTAPGAQILPVRVLDEGGSGTTDDVAAGIAWAAEQGADVINLSLGMLPGQGQLAQIVGALDPVYEAIDGAIAGGAVVVIAAGNETFPLCAEPSFHPDVLCVGATDDGDGRSWFSNFDATLSSHYVVAPGGHAFTCEGDVFSTYLRGEDSACGEDGYDAFAGTSMAAPFVSGVAALLTEQGMTNTEIVERIASTADDLGFEGQDPIYGYGRVNAARAVGSAGTDETPL